MSSIQSNPKIIFLMGPTAAGKTDAALRLCRDLPCQLISVDSALVYQGMDIGTAKPTPAVLKEFPHALIDIRAVTEPYSAAHFRSDALKEIESTLQQQKIPILVGGTMLYFRALLQGLAELPQASPDVRAELNARGQRLGWENMHTQLASYDPISARQIHPNDPQRIQRALEVYYLTGLPLSTWFEQQYQQPCPYPSLAINWAPADRAVLHQRIAARFASMLTQGFLDEVHTFYNNPAVKRELPAMRSVGYRQAWNYWAGEYSIDALSERAIIATRQLAKRQLTWLRHWPDIKWFNSSDNYYGNLLEEIKRFLEL